MVTIKDVVRYLETIAPLSLQENYDNAGLIAGNFSEEVKGVLLSLDCTEEIISEAITNKCNLVISHHPIVFQGLKKLNGKNYIERAVIKAIRNEIAVYAIHTNLDNVIDGVNKKIGEKLGLTNLKILSPKKNELRKLVTFCPDEHAEKIRGALFDAGCGRIGNYDECSFNIQGSGTFRALDGANPFVGEKGSRHTEPEVRIESVFQAHLEGKIIKALFASHPYETVAYDIYSLENYNQEIGSGMIGDLNPEMDEKEFLKRLKTSMLTGCVRHTALLNKNVKKVAICGGSGSFLLEDAVRYGADFFVTADYKYHQFFDADKRIVIADIGHYESEQFTSELLKELLVRNFSTFAVRLTELVTNPVQYY
jgi:dinuclear metal center YbgI/SA1388 family protein